MKLRRPPDGETKWRNEPGSGYYHIIINEPGSAYYYIIINEPGSAYYYIIINEPGSGYYYIIINEPGSGYHYIIINEPGSGYYYIISNEPGSGYYYIIIILLFTSLARGIFPTPRTTCAPSGAPALFFFGHKQNALGSNRAAAVSRCVVLGGFRKGAIPSCAAVGRHTEEEKSQKRTGPDCQLSALPTVWSTLLL